MFTLRKNGSERAESTNSDYVKGTAVQAPLIMLPSSLFQADLSDCRVILEKKGLPRGPCVQSAPPAGLVNYALPPYIPTRAQAASRKNPVSSMDERNAQFSSL